MRKNILLALLLPTALLVSCKSNIPEPLNSYLLDFTPNRVAKTVHTVDYNYVEHHYERVVADDGSYQYGDEIGRYTNHTILNNDEDDYSYTIEETWSGATIMENDEVGFAPTYRFTELKRVPDTDTWTLTTTTRGAAGQEHVALNEDLGSGNAKSYVLYYLYGSQDYYTGGFYYGDFLRTQSRRFYQYMHFPTDESGQVTSYDELIYDPPANLMEEGKETYFDLYLVVDQLGMVKTRTMIGYDGDQQRFAVGETEATYTYFPEE